MKFRLLSFIVLTLAIASTINLVEANSTNVAVTPLIYGLQHEDEVPVFVQGIDSLGPGEVAILNTLGTVTTIAGSVAVLHTQRANLASVARLPFVSRIEHPWPLHVYLDKSVPETGADVVWDQVRDAYGRNDTGQGVIIGFIDTGIDWSHPDFAFPNGSTKILYIWDQTVQGHAPSGFEYGYECTSTDVQESMCPEKDTFGHGTHVAGIATSSGMATGNYTGVAPGANMIFVKSGHELCEGSSWTFDSSQIMDGISYIAKKAAQLGRRVVINLSLGGNIGGHDGSDPMEIALDAFVQAGTPIVVAAGNDAQDNAHIQGQITQDMNVTFDIAVRETTTALAIDIWHSNRDEIQATLTTPYGRTYTIPTPTGERNVTYGNVTAFASSTNLGRELYLEFNAQNPISTSGWSVTLRAQQLTSTGAWDAWVDTTSCIFPGASFLAGKGYSIEQNDTVGIPGTAHNVVTVGAYVTKTSWKGMNGQTFGPINADTGQITSFSSRGPTRDGRIKPDVVAPGMLITSARSNATAKRPTDPDAFHRILAGTSMAAPHVAGVIALLLQYRPNLAAIEIPEIIRNTARLDRYTGTLAVGSPAWGFGKVDARTAVGMFRVTVIPEGVPDNIRVLVLVDDRKWEGVTIDSWLYIYFPKGTTHTLSIYELLPTETGSRYHLVSSELIGGDSIRLLNYAIGGFVKYPNVGETGDLILKYEIVTSSLVLVLPSIVLLVLSIVAFSFCFEIYRSRKGKDH